LNVVSRIGAGAPTGFVRHQKKYSRALRVQTQSRAFTQMAKVIEPSKFKSPTTGFYRETTEALGTVRLEIVKSSTPSRLVSKMITLGIVFVDGEVIHSVAVERRRSWGNTHM